MPPKAKSEGSFKKGEKVKARWSGSHIFYDAKILDVNPRTCKVQFDDGSVFNVKHADIKSPSKQDRSEKEPDPIPKRTRSRSRSTGRARSRSKSPARTERKSTPAKNEKKLSKMEKNKFEDSPSINSVKKDEIDSATKSSLTRERIGFAKEEVKASVSSVTTTNSYSTKNLFISVEKKDPIELRLRSSQFTTLPSPETSSQEIKMSYEKTNAIPQKDETKYSDDEESEEEEEIKVIPKKPSKLLQIFSFLLTLLRIIVMPTFLLFFVYACTKKQCTVLEVPQFYSKWKDFENAVKICFPAVALFHLAICLSSLIPLGRKVTGFPYGLNRMTKEYRMNGIFCFITFIIVFAICSYFGVYMNWGYEKFKGLTLSIVLYCTFCALLMHIISSIKGGGSKESKVPLIGNFFHGIHYNPFLFQKVDVKTSFIRAGLIGSVLFNLSILLKYFLMKGYITIPLALTTGMQLFFVIDFFIREEKMLSTATYTSDSVGFGFIMMTGFLIPVGLALQNVYLYIFETKAHFIPHYCSAAVLALFFCGYYIYMSSGNLKHNFRRNPFSPSLSDVNSIPTSQKKRLISSKLWGIVRHPNYLGLIIMAIAWTLPCGITHLIPFGPLAMLIVALVVRSFRIETECREKYGPAWNNYCEIVKSRFIPYIF